MENPATQNIFDTPRCLVRTACWARLRSEMSEVTGMDTEQLTYCLRKRQMGNMVHCMVPATKKMY
jgi:hypothetical protein